MLWLNKYTLCMKCLGFTHPFWVLPLTKMSCCVKWCILYCILIFILFCNAPQRRTLHSATKLMCVSTRIYCPLLCKIITCIFQLDKTQNRTPVPVQQWPLYIYVVKHRDINYIFNIRVLHTCGTQSVCQSQSTFCAQFSQLLPHRHTVLRNIVWSQKL